MDRIEARNKLVRELLEWKNAGGPIDAVVDAIENLIWVVEIGVGPRPPTPLYAPPLSPPKDGSCLICGGYHGGLQCPRMTPMCESSTQSDWPSCQEVERR